MSKNELSVAGVGTALVDIKVVEPAGILPQKPQEVSEYLSFQQEAHKSAGGSVASTMVTLASLMTGGRIDFLQRVGMDDNGSFYRREMPVELNGGLQVDMVHPTGVCIFAVTKGGQDIDQWPEVTFYGASDKLEIPKGTGNSGEVFVTNLNSYKRFAPKGQIIDTLYEVSARGSIFVFRLSGIRHGTDELFDKEELSSLLSSLPRSPDILFANAVEIQHVSEIKDVYQAMQVTFPQARLMVVTHGENGSLVRFEGNIFEIPPESLSQNEIIDTTGAGDSYMGSMLAALFTRSYSQWGPEFIVSCAEIGTYAASLVIQSLQSRLTVGQLASIRQRILLMKVGHGTDNEL